jgi:hypothetical protein
MLPVLAADGFSSACTRESRPKLANMLVHTHAHAHVSEHAGAGTQAIDAVLPCFTTQMLSSALCLSHGHEMRSAMKPANPESLILLAVP